MTVDQLMKFIGEMVLYGGGATGIAYLMFQQFGKAWLENKFSQRLDELRHEHNKEVARLRVEIDSVLNGTLRLQDKEFEILPRVWELLDKCFLQLILASTPFVSYAEIDMMSEDQVEELLALTNFTESQKKSVRQANPKRKKYVDYLIWERINDAYETSVELGNFISLNGILLPLDLKEKFKTASTQLDSIAGSLRSIILHKIPISIHDHFQKVQDIRPQLDEIETIIQARLASHASKPNT